MHCMQAPFLTSNLRSIQGLRPARQATVCGSPILRCQRCSPVICARGNLTIGLEFFLVTQVLYIVTFSMDIKAQRSRIPITILLIAHAVTMDVILTPSLGEMMLPFYAYITVITTIGIFAALRASKSKLVLYGALSFIVPNSILAINKFMVLVPARDYLIMITYYPAKFLIFYKSVISD